MLKFNVFVFILAIFSTINTALALEPLKVGAVPTPHALILEQIKPELEKEGYALEIFEFTDGVQPNIATDNGFLDANYFQHKPYLTEFNKAHNTKLVAVSSIHLEPMGVYSNKFKEFKPQKGARVAIPNNPTNEARALQILASTGIIKLKKSELATPLDISENTLELKFIEIKDAQLVRSLEDVDFAVINGNFALQAGFNPAKDALVLESTQSEYANYVVVKQGNEKSPKTQALIKALRTEKIKAYINANFKGAVIPTF
ncbi:ABC transporter substrate-binding protein [Campylobacter sp. MIT 12-5580]|uniref:MetQ/NlpA family ABC transporter substrate-binding protein n=1 Tax=Campylobacter sp. MIT 12-5580 TaxID=2040651 RepID=UPI0010F79D0B|nr:MetQ/NlpA family ABC transporter substrate-binding protein [Campylobacter sp. MIT 12-5580]TKX30393.1 ABC transporter substrate-binding protein [Campylobacter sp. MIT 12-5580]